MKSKDIGIQLSFDHANDVIDGWGEKAYSFLTEFAKSNAGNFTTEDIRNASKWIVPEPPKGQAWGAVIIRAAKSGLIKKVGYDTAKNAQSHSRPVTVWTKG